MLFINGIALVAIIAYGDLGIAVHLRTLAILGMIAGVVALVRLKPPASCAEGMGRIPCEACGYDL